MLCHGAVRDAASYGCSLDRLSRPNIRRALHRHKRSANLNLKRLARRHARWDADLVELLFHMLDLQKASDNARSGRRLGATAGFRLLAR